MKILDFQNQILVQNNKLFYWVINIALKTENISHEYALNIFSLNQN